MYDYHDKREGDRERVREDEGEGGERERDTETERERERRSEDVKMIYADVRIRSCGDVKICADVKMAHEGVKMKR